MGYKKKPHRIIDLWIETQKSENLNNEKNSTKFKKIGKNITAGSEKTLIR